MLLPKKSRCKCVLFVLALPSFAIGYAQDIPRSQKQPSLPSRLLFKYVNPLVRKSKETELTFNDALPSTKNTRRDGTPLLRRFQKARSKQPEGNAAKQLAVALLASQKSEIVTSGVLRLANTAVQAFPALLIAKLLRLLETGSSRKLGVRAALQLVAVLSLKMMLENQYFDAAIQTSMAVRSSLAELVFNKSLSVADTNNTSTGGILNLMQSDVGFLESAALQLHTAWDAILQIAMYVALLYKFLGKAVWYGVAVLCVTIPLNAVILRYLASLSTKEINARQARTQRTTESLRSIQLLKLLAWDAEPAIRAERDRELALHERRGLVRATNSAIANAVPAAVLVATMAAYSRMKQPITASVVFTAISLFNQLRFPLFFLPMWMDSFANASAATKRLAKFLTQKEIVKYHEPRSDMTGMELKNGNFLWPATKVPALEDVNVKFAPGSLTAVVGSVGSGKSALIQALLGELQPLDVNGTATERATVTMGGSNSEIAYCSQQAWLPKGSVRDAIVFGRPLDAQRYQMVKYCAGLDGEPVLTDDTNVGEGGSSLSGGQRARVSLARALYSENASVFLLDDCLAALDAKVKSTVLERITSYVRQRGAVTVLVTNDPYVPQRCDQVVLMGNTKSTSVATVVGVGTYEELQRRGFKLHELADTPVKEELEEPKYASSSTMLHSSPRQETRSAKAAMHPKERDIARDSKIHVESTVREPLRVVGGSLRDNSTETVHNVDCEEQAVMEKCPDCIADQSTKLHHRHNFDREETDTEAPQRPEQKHDSAVASIDDKMAGGAVPFRLYLTYLKSVRSPMLILAMLGSFLLSNGAQFFQQYTVAKWTEAGVEAVSGKYLQTLLRAAGVVSLALWIRGFLTLKVGLRASRFWHDSMISSVFSAPMSFFDATPSGQLLSRFGNEIGVVDRGVPDSFANVLFCFLQIFMSAGALIGVVTPGMLVPIAVVGVLYTKMMSRFRPAARDMKRSESKTRSPIYTHFGEAIRGAATIRSIPSAPQTWLSTHKDLSDYNLRVFRTAKALDRWLSIRLETLGNSLVLAAAVSSVFLSKAGRLTTGSAGWGLTQSLAITGLMAWAVRTLTDLESNVMSVKRVQELTDVETEGRSEKEQQKIPRELSRPGEALPLIGKDPNQVALATQTSNALLESGWPWRGNVRFSNVSMRYNEGSPLVLRNMSLDIPAGSTLGVVGRTGSGKSSLLLTLFRLVEIENEGSIYIDGVDIRSVGMEQLRKSLSIIPQDPTLFTGTIASNLDATGAASTEDMMSALYSASPELAEFFKDGEGLDTLVTEGGQNLSVGQRQLVCLARALLRKSKILVLDEATSSVDATTDRNVQNTIRREFVNKGVTVITVAHRLETILGYDRIAVLGDGEVIEYGSPADLLKIPNGELSRLVEADRKNKQVPLPV